MRILIIRNDARGDVLLTTPAIRGMSEAYPNAEIHYLTRRDPGEVLIGNPYIYRIHYFERIQSLNGIHFDLAYDLRDRPGIVPWKAEKTIQAINNPIMRSDTISRINRHTSGKKFSELYAEIMGIKLPRGAKNEIYIPKHTQEAMDHHLSNLGLLHKRFIAVALDSCWQSKRIPRQEARDIVESLEQIATVVLMGKKNGIRKKSRGGRFYNMVGKTSIMEAASIIRRASLYVGIDSLPLHLADTLGIPSVSIWTSTHPDTILTDGSFDHPIISEAQCNPCFKQICKNPCIPNIARILQKAREVYSGNKTEIQIIEKEEDKLPMTWVVMPCFNQFYLTFQAIHSIHDKTRGYPFRILLIDDGGDKIHEYNHRALESIFPHLEIYRMSRNSGFVGATNAGIEIALSKANPRDNILWLNNDIFIEDPDWLIKIIEGTGEREISGPVGSVLQEDFRHAGWRSNPGSYADYIDGWCLFAPISAYREIGILDSGIRSFSEDADWCIRARRKGYRIRVLGDIGIKHLHHQTHKAMGMRDAHIPSLHYMRKKWESLNDALLGAGNMEEVAHG